LTGPLLKFKFVVPPKQRLVTSTTISKILLVDDDQDDSIFLSESFAANYFSNLICTSGGEEAIKYLNSVAAEELPSLIILDLNMPKWDGRQTLNYIKANSRFSSIPVVILSTSDNKIDKEICKRLGAVSYLQKPYHYDGYKEIVRNCIPLIKA
jgi:two-component system response regulator